MRIPTKWPMAEFGIVFLPLTLSHSITSTWMRHTFQRMHNWKGICVCAVCAYKFHLILSIRFFIGLNEQFTENLADIFKWMSPARYKCKCFVDMRIVYVRCEHLTLEKTFDSDFQVYFIGSVKTRWNFFSLSQNSFFVCLASEKRIKFEIAFGFVHLCLFLKTIVLVVLRIAFCIWNSMPSAIRYNNNNKRAKRSKNNSNNVFQFESFLCRTYTFRQRRKDKTRDGTERTTSNERSMAKKQQKMENSTHTKSMS